MMKNKDTANTATGGGMTRHQGRVVVEWETDGSAGDWMLVMTPDGAVTAHETRKSAEKHARRWFKAHMDGASVGIGQLEWRL